VLDEVDSLQLNVDGKTVFQPTIMGEIVKTVATIQNYLPNSANRISAHVNVKEMTFDQLFNPNYALEN
jgi:hypothetical protein